MSTPPPLATAVLARLAVAGGEPVTVDEVARDVWGVSPPRRGDRVAVQKRVLMLRRLFDQGSGDGSGVIVTEPGRVSTYRLALRSDQVDLWRFQELVRDARRLPLALAVAGLSHALDLWRGRPLQDVEGYEFADGTIARLRALHETAQRELARAHTAVGDNAAALAVTERLAESLPEDLALGLTVSELRSRVREEEGAVLARRCFPAMRTSVSLVYGDLLHQSDADLVIGFTDTFDTVTDDRVIHRDSLQGQLLHILFCGDRKRLDDQLRRELRHVPAESVESRSDKRLGKLTRYPLGTIVTLWADEQRIFGVAYSRMGNDLAARSSPQDLAHGMERLWEHTARHGWRRPVAIGLVGAGLARVDGLGPQESLATVVRSFLARSRIGTVSPELRLVVRPDAIAGVGPTLFAKFLGEQEDGATIDGPRTDQEEAPSMSVYDGRTTASDSAAGYDDAVEALNEVLRWRLPPADWEQVSRSVYALALALRDGGAEELLDATTTLEDLAPSRVIRAGSAPQEGDAEPQLRERVNVLLHELTHGGDGSRTDIPVESSGSDSG
ncbi:CATRA system-associated protein [Streptomyces durocortorensis]|uniref:Bacterial transcriptional activator domain-containing protein n=1 Tax=Streptomyces durocortorensis TaxID=2811104 RepID=A0ABS2HTU3_9ACTN|nr:CATRA system-associated protein [Streptomyces durocortorensis]MBM7053168.1 bacterial transcriptional activator domain-containing protein [Streptomyces durocortorensis]